MRKLLTIAAILTTSVVVEGAIAADGMMPAPLPGPFQNITMPTPNVTPAPYGSAQNAAAPQVGNTQPYWSQAPNQQLPYWMQGQQQPFNGNNYATSGQGNAASNAQAGGQGQGGFDFNTRAQGQNTNTFNQGYGNGSAPGYFPGYAAAQPVQNMNTQPRATAPAPQAQPAQPAPYQGNNGWNNGPWNSPWGSAPWGNPAFGPWGPQWGNYGQPSYQQGNGPMVGR